MVNVTMELSRYLHHFSKPSGLGGLRFTACSPFRISNEDRTPSFFVDLREDSEYYGCWYDSSADDPEWRSGNFTKLLAFLMAVSYEEAAAYLKLTYGEYEMDDPDDYRINPPRLIIDNKRKITLNERILDEYRREGTYLDGRGITPEVQRLVGTGYSEKTKAISLPWRHPDGTLANVKYRKTDSKVFWYAKGGHPVGDLVYGIDVIHRKNIRRAALVEAEIDSQTIMSARFPAIATGGSAFTDAKASLIIRSPIEEILIAPDHDKAGQAFLVRATELLAPHITLRVIDYPNRYKDVNEFAIAEGSTALAECIESAQMINTFGVVLPIAI